MPVNHKAKGSRITLDQQNRRRAFPAAKTSFRQALVAP